MQIRKRVAAYVTGGSAYPNIRGTVSFTNVYGGTKVQAVVDGLPPFSREDGKMIGPHGFHLHAGTSCAPGTPDNPFPEAGAHYNPTGQPHGNEAGDFPVLFSNNGKARMTFFTNKLRAEDALGKAVIIHEMPDDDHTQPSGGSGKKIACGIVMNM